eukprot:3269719-Prymnesium_polylepis.1
MADRWVTATPDPTVPHSQPAALDHLAHGCGARSRSVRTIYLRSATGARSTWGAAALTVCDHLTRASTENNSLGQLPLHHAQFSLRTWRTWRFRHACCQCESNVKVKAKGQVWRIA